MPVEIRYVVKRNDVEVKTFMDKKAADEYDKMLDIADNIAELLDKSPISFSEDDKEKLSIYFSKQREDLLVALQAKKPKPLKKDKEEGSSKPDKAEAVKLKKAS